MFHPVGNQRSAVYWRRRLIVLGTLAVIILLLGITLKVAFGSDAGTPVGQGTSSTPQRTTSTSPTSRSSSTQPSTSTSSRPTKTVATPQPCVASALAIKAVTGKSTYQPGDDFRLALQVTNTGDRSCIQDLADSQIELIVYNGESRVWGSHDCQVLAGTHPMTLVPDAPVRVTVVWGGQSSAENDKHTQSACGPRQVVGPGSYTLIAKLAGKQGTAAQFAIG